ncbi:MAG: type IV pilus assembly protein PilM [Pirellulaceae bacterium]
MVRWFSRKRFSPIGLDIGTRSVKLVQFTADQSQIVETSRWDLGIDDFEKLTPEERIKKIGQGIRNAHEGRRFHGKNVVACLTDRQLYLQNVRIPKGDQQQLERLVQQEAAGRVPYAMQETEIRYIEAADIRHGDQVMREVVLLACHRPLLEEALATIEEAGLRPVAIDVEPAALLRSFVKQLRRDEDKHQRTLLVHVGGSRTVVVICQDEDLLFVKYLPLGGRHMDEAVARHLKMPHGEAASLRKHNGDRRAGQQDPEIARSVAEATRPVVEKLAAELSMCIRYHSVTFRGQPLVRLVLGGGEATPQLLESLSARLNLKCELSDPFRGFEQVTAAGHRGQWEVAAGLALREVGP